MVKKLEMSRVMELWGDEIYRGEIPYFSTLPTKPQLKKHFKKFNSFYMEYGDDYGEKVSMIVFKDDYYHGTSYHRWTSSFIREDFDSFFKILKSEHKKNIKRAEENEKKKNTKI